MPYRTGRRRVSSSRKTTASFTETLFPSDPLYWEQSEDWHQAQLVMWWRKNRPTLIFAVPNGGWRSKSQAARMKVTGTLAGVWDLFIPEERTWIEMKRADKGRLSAEQQAFGRRMVAAEYRCIAAWGWWDAVVQLQEGERAEWRRDNSQH